MADQPQLDLPPPSAPETRAAKRRVGFGGFTRVQMLILLLLVAAIIWGMWVTRALTQSKQDHIVSARLSALVGDYVEAQRFSGSPPDRVPNAERDGAPDRIRTCGPQIRNLMLYPTELRARRCLV